MRRAVMFFAIGWCLLSVTLAGAQDWVVRPGTCGNGVVEVGEACDPGFPDAGIEPELGSARCASEGFTGGGKMACRKDCTLDLSGCSCDPGQRAFPATGQTQCWDLYGRHIDCAGTGLDGDVRAGAPLSYTDNGDGTITDDNTGLMWEKKDDGGGIHDWHFIASWGRALSMFIEPLNHTCEGDGVVECGIDDDCGAGGQCGFAGFRDWRLPNVKELQSIVDYSLISGPTVHPAFHGDCSQGCEECSCTRSSVYWSSTSYLPCNAWNVDFNTGAVGNGIKHYSFHVRAVRGGV